jgi:hypothetical protein
MEGMEAVATVGAVALTEAEDPVTDKVLNCDQTL